MVKEKQTPSASACTQSRGWYVPHSRAIMHNANDSHRCCNVKLCVSVKLQINIQTNKLTNYIFLMNRFWELFCYCHCCWDLSTGKISRLKLADNTPIMSSSSYSAPVLHSKLIMHLIGEFLQKRSSNIWLVFVSLLQCIYILMYLINQAKFLCYQCIYTVGPR